MPAISVIMPVYNKEKYIAEALRSVLTQTMADFELIVINDGSTDESLRIIRSYEASDERVRVLNIPNGGVSHARNCGLEIAVGQYITFMDADDTVHPEYLQNMYQQLITHDADMVISGVEKYWHDRPERKPVHAPFEGLRTISEVLPVFAGTQKQTGIFGMCVSKMFPRTLIATQRFDEQLALAEDFDFYLRLYAQVKKICFDQRCLYYYLQETENSSVKISDAQIDYCAQFRVSLRYRQFLQNQDSYWGENREIVDRQISNYLFYALHYCPRQQFRTRFRTLHALCEEYRAEYTGSSMWQKIVLSMFRCNTPGLEAVLIGGYHSLRKCIGGRP